MTTTIMKDSQIGDAWIRDACNLNTIQRVIDPKTGQPNGNILTGPVRLAFCDPLFTPQTPSNNPQGKPKYGTMALYTPFSNFTVMYEDWYKLLGEQFREYYVDQQRGYAGLMSPFNDQVQKSVKYAGFTPGLMYMNHTTQYMPQIVDVNGNSITDRNRVYPGVWAILAVNVYGYGKVPPQPKKGAAFGLQQVMIIADDTKLAGGAPDPRTTFANVNVKPPVVAPSVAFGLTPPPGAPPAPMGGMYPPHASVPPPLGRMTPPMQTVPQDEDVSMYS